MIKINFNESRIRSVKISNEDRMRILEGGKTGSFIVLEIDELLPEERQNVQILVKGKSVPSLSAWSQSNHHIENIFIMDLIIEPD